LSTRTIIIGAVVVVVIIIAAIIAIQILPSDGDDGDHGGTAVWVLTAHDYVNYTISFSNGTLIGYWNCRVVEVIPEAQSVTWNITQTFHGNTNSWQVSTNWGLIFAHMGEFPIGVIDSTRLPGYVHAADSISTHWGMKNCDHWYTEGNLTTGFWYYKGVIMKYVADTQLGSQYVMTLTDTSLSFIIA
jgi:hypothetical protein